MALLLHIDTATEKAGICISQNGEILYFSENPSPKDHASWLHPAIATAVSSLGMQMESFNGVSVTSGPGSYTGLRVGMATAKGICFTLKIPFITENTLKVMAHAATKIPDAGISWLCPMIDARRMEVFTALFNPDLEEIMLPAAIVLTDESFDGWLQKGKVLFFGSGAEKWSKLQNSPNALVKLVEFSAKDLAVLAEKKFQEEQFTDISYTEPVYTKEFFTHTKK